MRRLLVAVLVLALLGVVADFAAKWYAEGRVATLAQDRLGTSATPGVTIHGFPFLTQVLAHRLGSVTVTVPSLRPAGGTGQGLRVTRLDATFDDVVLSPGFSAATARSVVGSATVPFAAVNALGPFRVSYAGRSANGVGLVSIRPTGSALPVAVKVGVAVSGGDAVSFVGADGSTRLPPRLVSLLGATALQGHPLTGLPSRFRLRSLRVTRHGIQVTLTGRHIALAG